MQGDPTAGQEPRGDHHCVETDGSKAGGSKAGGRGRLLSSERDGSGRRFKAGDQGINLGREVASQGGVAATYDAQRAPTLATGHPQVGPDLVGQGGGRGRDQAAGVGEHEKTVRPGHLRGQVRYLPGGQYRHAVHGLGAGGVIVQHHHHAGPGEQGRGDGVQERVGPHRRQTGQGRGRGQPRFLGLSGLGLWWDHERCHAVPLRWPVTLAIWPTRSNHRLISSS